MSTSSMQKRSEDSSGGPGLEACLGDEFAQAQHHCLWLFIAETGGISKTAIS